MAVKSNGLWKLELAVDGLEQLLREKNPPPSEVRAFVHQIGAAYHDWVAELEKPMSLGQ